MTGSIAAHTSASNWELGGGRADAATAAASDPATRSLANMLRKVCRLKKERMWKWTARKLAAAGCYIFDRPCQHGVIWGGITIEGLRGYCYGDGWRNWEGGCNA